MKYKFKIGDKAKIVSSGNNSFLNHFLDIGEEVVISMFCRKWKSLSYYVTLQDGTKYSEPILENELELINKKP